VIIMGNRQVELAWWKQQHAANGYTTFSSSSAPGMVAFAFWVTQQVLDGKKVPHDLVVPAFTISQDQLDTALQTAPVGGVANVVYTQQDTLKDIAATAAK
jgi:ribose transport system substrate-binding protein